MESGVRQAMAFEGSQRKERLRASTDHIGGVRGHRKVALECDSENKEARYSL